MYIKRPVPQTSIRVCPAHFIRISIYVSYIYYVYIYICFIYIFHTYIYIYIYVHNETRSTDVYTGMPAYFKCISPAHFKCCAHDTQRYCTIGCTVCSASAQYAALSSICTAICMQPLDFQWTGSTPAGFQEIFRADATLCTICSAMLNMQSCLFAQCAALQYAAHYCAARLYAQYAALQHAAHYCAALCTISSAAQSMCSAR